MNQLHLVWEAAGRGADRDHPDRPQRRDVRGRIRAPWSQALNGVTGDLLWEYKRKLAANGAGQARTKNLADLSGLVIL